MNDFIDTLDHIVNQGFSQQSCNHWPFGKIEPGFPIELEATVWVDCSEISGATINQAIVADGCIGRSCWMLWTCCTALSTEGLSANKVLIAATEEGNKELAVVDGYRESTQSWRELLGQLKRMGLSTANSKHTNNEAMQWQSEPSHLPHLSSLFGPLLFHRLVLWPEQSSTNRQDGALKG